MGRMDVLAEDVKGIGFVCATGSFYQLQGLEFALVIIRTTYILGCQTEFKPQPGEDIVLPSLHWICVAIFLVVSTLTVLFDLQ